VLVVRGDGGREWLSERLRWRGAIVQPLAAYHRALPVLDTAQRALLDAARGQPARHLWLLSSAQCIDHLRRLDGGADWAGARALASDARIAGLAAEAGVGTVLQAAPMLTAVTACIQCLDT